MLSKWKLNANLPLMSQEGKHWKPVVITPKQNKDLGQGSQSERFNVACRGLTGDSSKDYKDWFQQELFCTCLSQISVSNQ